jgi:hypothetical protein
MDSVDQQWDFVLSHSDEEIRRIATRASHEPVLRRLFPYPSMRNPRFSMKVDYPYDPMPYICTEVPGERYQVRAADNAPIMQGALADVVQELTGLLSREPQNAK